MRHQRFGGGVSAAASAVSGSAGAPSRARRSRRPTAGHVNRSARPSQHREEPRRLGLPDRRRGPDPRDRNLGRKLEARPDLDDPVEVSSPPEGPGRRPGLQRSNRRDPTSPSTPPPARRKCVQHNRCCRRRTGALATAASLPARQARHRPAAADTRNAPAPTRSRSAHKPLPPMRPQHR